jgi:hypothetical protein
MSARNSLRHGAYASRPVAIPRGRLAEDEQDVIDFVDSVIDALAPRDVLEREQAHRVAMSYLRLRRVGRFEAHALAVDGADLGEEQVLLLAMSGMDTSAEGQEERAAVRALQQTMERVTTIEARTSQSLDRSLLIYSKLQERTLDSDAIEASTSNSETNPSLTRGDLSPL